MDIRKSIYNTLWITTALSVTIIVVCAIVSGCNGEQKPIFNAITLYGSYFGGIATLAAAYIASLLFNKWQDQHNKNIESNLILKIVESFNSFDEKLSYFYGPISNSYDREQIEAPDPIFEKLNNNKFEILFDLQMSFLKAIDSIEKYSIVEGNYEIVHEDLKKYKSDFRCFLKKCENVDYSNVPSSRDTLSFHYGELVKVLRSFEQIYVNDLLIKLKE